MLRQQELYSLNAVLMLSVLHANAFVLLVGLATEANVVEEGMMEEAGIGYVRLGKKKKKKTTSGHL